MGVDVTQVTAGAISCLIAVHFGLSEGELGLHLAYQWYMIPDKQ